MTRGKILIVDDEEEVCETIQARLQALDYDASYVLNGSDALQFVKKSPPDLILLDILMPGVDGYEVAEKIIKNNPSSPIPIIMLTALHSQQSKLKALTMGIDDYITKPFDFEELVARVENVLRRGKQKDSPVRKMNLSSDDLKRLDLLREMKKAQMAKLDPVYNLQSATGYNYPLAARILNTNDGSESTQLEILAQRKCFQKEFFDKILICPFCKNYNLNIRETCPSCKSANIKIVDMIHHYRCAYTGIEEEFKQGIRYVCPKCHLELKNIGVDYDKPGQNYLCESCDTHSPESETRGQCRACLQIFLVENALRHTIFSYLMTQEAFEVCEKGIFGVPTNPNPEMAEGQEVYNLSYFRALLTQELLQADHFKRSLSLILLTVENFKMIQSEQGEGVSSKLMKQVTEFFKAELRSIDLPAQFQENSLVAMLLECNQELVREIAARIRSKLAKAIPQTLAKLNVSVRTASFPEDGKSEDVLLKKLLEAKPLA